MAQQFSDGRELSRHRSQVYAKRMRRRKRMNRRIAVLAFSLLVMAFGLFKVNAMIRDYLVEKNNDNRNYLYSNQEEKSADQAADANAEAVGAKADAQNFNRADILSGLTDEYALLAETILDELSNVKGIAQILNHIEEYPKDVLEMLIRNPETIHFVTEYLDKIDNQGIAGSDVNIANEYKKGAIPLFIQWDERWGYETYGDNIMAINGCGPTCLAMVYVGLKGDTAQNPLSLAEYSANQNHYANGAGTKWSLMTEGAERLGLSVSQLGSDKDAIINYLSMGRPIIASVMPGDFTTIGHFIVLTGIADNGEIIVNDPNSRKRSSQTWELNRLMNQFKNLWVFS